MPFPELAKQPYFDAPLQAYEAEFAGETYFKTLTGVFSEPGQQEKLMLLADVEHRTWMTLRPLIKRHRLEPLDSGVLATQGKT